MLEIFVILLLAYVVYLDRRLGRLERNLAQPREAYARCEASTPRDWEEPVAPEAPEPVVEQPAMTPAMAYSDAQPEEEWVSGAAEELAPEPEPAGRRFALNFEELFGRRLPIWAGGITLAVAGVLIVKLSIEAGLLSPFVRVVMGMIFGAGLIAGAEAALRYHERVGDVRVRQALSGAGIASLYASILVAANLYGLVPPLIAMLGMAAVTAVAMLLSVRFGAPSALLGLAGGLAAPALIGSPEPNVPLLTLYLALAIAGLATLSRNQRWAWLGVSALVGGFGWGLVLLLGGALEAPDTISLGLYILLLGIGIPALGLAGQWRDRVQLIAGILAAAQMAALVATGGFALLHWGLFALIAIATVWLAAREQTLERLPAVGLTVALLLAGAWPSPELGRFALVMGGIALIHGAMPLRRLWSERGGLLDAAQIAAILLGTWLLPMLHFHRLGGLSDNSLGLVALGLSVAAAVIAGFGWTNPGRSHDSRFVVVATCAGLLLAASASLLLPVWLVGVAIAATGLGLLHLGQKAADERFEPIAWIFAIAGLIAFVAPDALIGNRTAEDSLRFALMAAVAGLFAWLGRVKVARGTAEFLVPVLVYFAVAPWVSERLEPLLAALMLPAIAWAGRFLTERRLVPALAAAVLMSLAWAIVPLSEWTVGASASVFAYPMLLDSVPGVETTLMRLLIPGTLAGVSVWIAHGRLRRHELAAGYAFAALLGAVGLHSLYKHLFAIGSPDEFVSLGLAERTLWQVLLAGVAAAAVRFGQRNVALAFAGASAAHFALYTLLLHNPLWAAQAVGAVPFANLLLPAYALPLALLVIAGRSAEAEGYRLGRALALGQMLLISLFAFSSLRQMFHGSLLVEPGLGQAEDICRSILAIALAVGFLLWGIARGERDWRIASLALMIAAVGKVFLFDASGLEGLTRVASFFALGMSLIGIGWLYSRHLTGAAPQLAKLASSR